MDEGGPVGCVFHAAKGLGAMQLDLASGRERSIRVDQEAASLLGGVEAGELEWICSGFVVVDAGFIVVL